MLVSKSGIVFIEVIFINVRRSNLMATMGNAIVRARYSLGFLLASVNKKVDLALEKGVIDFGNSAETHWDIV